MNLSSLIDHDGRKFPDIAKGGSEIYNTYPEQEISIQNGIARKYFSTCLQLIQNSLIQCVQVFLIC